jgi:hypothetical protein
MATPSKPPSYSQWIDEMHASARMRARLMRKIPKPTEFPRRSVDVTNLGPLGQSFGLVGATAAAVAPEEPPPSSSDDNQNRV